MCEFVLNLDYVLLFVKQEQNKICISRRGKIQKCNLRGQELTIYMFILTSKSNNIKIIIINN